MRNSKFKSSVSLRYCRTYNDEIIVQQFNRNIRERREITGLKISGFSKKSHIGYLSRSDNSAEKKKIQDQYAINEIVDSESAFASLSTSKRSKQGV